MSPEFPLHLDIEQCGVCIITACLAISLQVVGKVGRKLINEKIVTGL